MRTLNDLTPNELTELIEWFELPGGELFLELAKRRENDLIELLVEKDDQEARGRIKELSYQVGLHDLAMSQRTDLRKNTGAEDRVEEKDVDG